MVDLSWTNPADPDLAGVLIVRDTVIVSFPTDGAVIFTGMSEMCSDSGLTNDTTYYYGIFAYDGSLNYSVGQFISATPTAP